MKTDSDDLIFRMATNADLPGIIALVKEVLGEFNLVYSPESSESDLADIEEGISSGGYFEVATDQMNNIIATVSLVRISDQKCKLRKMYVTLERRGEGIGEELLKHALDRARIMGFKEIILETTNSMKAAISLYKKYGFIEQQAEKADSPRCEIVMMKKL